MTKDKGRRKKKRRKEKEGSKEINKKAQTYK